MTESDLIVELTKQGYYDIKRLPNGELAGLCLFAFTTAIVVGLNEWNYRIRYCFPIAIDALVAFQSYTGEGHPDSSKWIKAKGRNIDLLNPRWVNEI